MNCGGASVALPSARKGVVVAPTTPDITRRTGSLGVRGLNTSSLHGASTAAEIARGRGLCATLGTDIV